MKTEILIILILSTALLLGLSYYWCKNVGLKKGVLITICRLFWITPFILCLFPLTEVKELPRTAHSQLINIFLDDSQSMKSNHSIYIAKSHIRDLKENCKNLGCKVKVSRLSEMNSLTKLGYSPIIQTFASWSKLIKEQAWILFSDGAHYQPTVSWPNDLKNIGDQNGLIMGFFNENIDNTWIDHVTLDPITFDGKTTVANISLKRSAKQLDKSTIQVHAILNGKILQSVNTIFYKDKKESDISMVLPPLAKGHHLIKFKALPTGTEIANWDNYKHEHIEVLPNTLGVLHLLGSPSWDGRFLRRFLKSEPKYDLISFFILRDPWDIQGSDERELSLIPFPVARLFNEELENFKIIILQNFSLLQFLLPEYQTNLVNFVKNGGGLLFLGGGRSLLNTDIQDSPLKEILPFHLKEKINSGNTFNSRFSINNNTIDKKGVWFDSNYKFKIGVSNPSKEKKSLANVYDEWKNLRTSFQNIGNFQGLHNMKNVVFNKNKLTNLLYAKNLANRNRPLAIASYPEKGRALWLLSDSLWRLALNPQQNISRQVYNKFFQGAMTWLLRQEFKKPLMIKNFQLDKNLKQSISWSSILEGTAVKYFTKKNKWIINTCGLNIPFNQIKIKKIGSQKIQISSISQIKINGGDQCLLSIKGEHPAFGSVQSFFTSIFPEIFLDKEMISTPQSLENLSSITGAKLLKNPSKKNRELKSWLNKITINRGISLPPRHKSNLNFYWALEKNWLFIFLLFLPLEIIIRRWDQLF